MARVTTDDVKAILETDLDLTAFIATATALVDHHLLSVGYSGALLTELERWLAAWLACTRDPRFAQVSTDGQSMTFATQSYWETIALLDTSGRLVRALTSKPAYITID